MQVAKIIWYAKPRLVFVVFQQQYTEVIISHVRREIIPYDTFSAFVGFFVNNVGF
ncbi:hypothetical protein D3C78_1531900 [compost metagenome]